VQENNTENISGSIKISYWKSSPKFQKWIYPIIELDFFYIELYWTHKNRAQLRDGYEGDYLTLRSLWIIFSVVLMNGLWWWNFEVRFLSEFFKRPWNKINFKHCISQKCVLFCCPIPFNRFFSGQIKILENHPRTSCFNIQTIQTMMWRIDELPNFMCPKSFGTLNNDMF
jgi:hypothetical protein